MTTVLERLEEELAEQTDNGNQGKTHIVNPPMNTHVWSEGVPMTEVVEMARNFYWPLKMLCGLVFVPQYDTEAYPACENCIRIAGEIMAEEGE
jgi:hypothetical protein